MYPIALSALAASLLCTAHTLLGIDGVRSPTRDAANTLYLLLRLHNHSVAYEDVNAQLMSSRLSLLDLKKASSKCDASASIRKINGLDELARILPAIVSFDAPGSQGGTFILVYAIGGGHVDFVNGGFSTLDRMTLNTFARDWTGHALLIERSLEASFYSPRTLFTLAFSASISFGVCLLFHTISTKRYK